ncbi:MAG: hypothetical protein FJW68_03080 [Actinobacteria bacterium]|nr:hypothetical protein [Actinomycetota bacterium]
MDRKIKKTFLISIIFILAVLLIPVFTTASSCSIFGRYIVEQQHYDNLTDSYTKNLAEIEKIKAELQKSTAEMQQLSDSLEEKDSEIASLKNEIDYLNKTILMLEEETKSKSTENLEAQIAKLSGEPAKLRKLLDNINNLLKFVYIGSSAKEGYGYTFTAFSIEHKGKYYIITAGHCVSDNYGTEGTFKFKSNFSDTWIYPELLAYESAFWELDDYAVFYGDKIPGGLKTGETETEDNYVLGSLDKKLSVMRDLGGSSKRGESGSPVINEEMQVIGIYVVYGYVYTPIKLALEAIDNAVIN